MDNATQKICSIIAAELSLKETQVTAAVNLLDEGMTIPFISRYRKEMTGSLDDTQLRNLSDRLNYLRNLDKRKSEVISSIEEQGKMTDELMQKITDAKLLAEVEDLYRPYKQKRKTRASVAKEKGLEPLSQILLLDTVSDPVAEAEKYVDEEKGVANAEEALQGAMDIIAEILSDDAELRKKLREEFLKNSVISSKPAKEDADEVYKNYFEFSQASAKIAPHRTLALDRGEREGALKVEVALPEGVGEKMCIDAMSPKNTECGKYVTAACEDAWKRLIYPSCEREIRATLTEKACESSIKVFSSNLRQLLMQPPVKNSVTMGVDPAYRTGCKIAVIDDTGKVLDTTVVYPTPPQNKIEASKQVLAKMIAKYGVTTISIGNGTASRETESFIAELIREIPQKVSYMVVSEAGASVYSASKLAAEEFPDFDVTQRSAVSIARRLQDPLAELVKIEPKAVGVGQYQHDMPKARLDEALGGVVEDCVNSVGVDVNSASSQLLSYIAGINSAVAKNIVKYREENGGFTDRKQLLKVPKLGAKAYEQCAGFLRVKNAKNPLDNTAVHPESYDAAKEIIEKCGFTLADIAAKKADSIYSSAVKIGLINLSEQTGAGVATIKDILNELSKPGRDPRDELEPPLMRSGDVMELEDLKSGMELMGTVRNVIDFGCFVDIGVHEDGLVHISQICDKYIKHPLEAVKVGEVVKVKVLDVDLKRRRVALTMKGVSK